MRYKIIFSAVWLLSLTNTGFAQKSKEPLYVHKVAQGTWIFEDFGRGIVKGGFSASNPEREEQVSNAVTARAINSVSSTKINEIKGAAHLVFDGKDMELLGNFDSAGYRGMRLVLDKEEFITGAGERSVPLNRRGYQLPLYNNPRYGYGVGADNLNYSLPFIISSKGYGIFFDNPSRGYIDIGKTNANILEFGAISGKLDFYFIPGKDAHEILQKYFSLTGTQPIPARWVLGNLMSRFGYRSAAQVNETVAAMRNDSIPLDAVILDLFWFGDSIKGTMGNLAWTNKQKWPDPKGMIRSLTKQNVQTILITEPFVLNTTPNYKPSKKLQAIDSVGNPYLLTDFYFGNGGLLDIFRNKTQDWFWRKYNKQIKLGVAGWWGDLGEPERHPKDVYHNLSDLGFARKFSADEVHNIYGHYWDKMLYEKYAKHYPEQRLFNLNRSGYAGSPRYAVFPWSGDVSRSWDGLKAQLPLMLGMSMSGVPYIHADAGGFAGGEGDAELYTRWMQFAAFTPILRPHGTALGDLDPTVKNIPSEATFWPEPYKSIVRHYIQLRYKLLPYNYTLAYEQASNGKALVQPLFYYNFNDTNLLSIQDEFMWGDAMLVAPVLEKGIAAQKIYLPEGNWYRWADGQAIAGGKWIEEKLTLTDIPVFVKAGSFIPTFEPKTVIKSTADYSGENITVTYYPSASATNYVFFDDDGKSKSSLQKGRFELIGFAGVVQDNKANIKVNTISKQTLKARRLVLKLPQGYLIKSARLNGNAISIINNTIEVNYTGAPVDLSLSW